MDFNSVLLVRYSRHDLKAEWRSKSLLFKPLVVQPIRQTTYNLNDDLLVHFSSHDLNNIPSGGRNLILVNYL